MQLDFRDVYQIWVTFLFSLERCWFGFSFPWKLMFFQIPGSETEPLDRYEYVRTWWPAISVGNGNGKLPPQNTRKGQIWHTKTSKRTRLALNMTVDAEQTMPFIIVDVFKYSTYRWQQLPVSYSFLLSRFARQRVKYAHHVTWHTSRDRKCFSFSFFPELFFFPPVQSHVIHVTSL